MDKLFKSICNEKTSYIKNINKLIDAIKNNELECLLFNGNNIKNERKPSERICGFKNKGTRGDKNNEKRLCKCLYFKNNPNNNKKCKECIFENKFFIKNSKYKVIDYEAMSYYITGDKINSKDGIGNIDLIISDEIYEYATEVKPLNNPETLLRMIAEILTYTYGYESDKYKKAIAFFENSNQYKEYQNKPPKIMELIKLADINVFLFKETKENHKEYEIIKM